MSNLTTFPQAPKPSEKDLRGRTSIVRQGWRFAVLNLKMMAMIRKGHH